MAGSMYVHIPFCTHICYYCDFNKVFLRGQPVDEYLSALLKEIQMTFDRIPPEQMNTIFIGGGTPTALTARQLAYLLEGIHDHFNLAEDYEFTIEANPGDLTKEKLAVLREYGVNRLSIGVQSFRDRLLKKIGRVHRTKDVYESIDLAKEMGFSNISIDLMYALPEQTVEDVRHALDEFFKLDIQHCSAYSLIVEPKTIFYNLMLKGKLRLPSQDQESDMYELIMETMNEHGFFQYEISNYARPGYESKHNLVYWNNEEYYGFGAGAHSYLNQVRRSNINPIRKYIERLEQDHLPIRQEIFISKKEAMEEEMFLGLRKNAGVSITAFINKFSVDPLEYYKEEIQRLLEQGLLELADDSIRLTKKGRMLGNEVFMAFIGD